MGAQIREYADRMRQQPTAAERRFFERVSNLDCHAQIVIGRYIADFLFPTKGIVVEVDGGYHDDAEQQFKDIERDLWMKQKGLKVIRIRNEDVESFPISTLNNAKLAPRKVRDWLASAVAFSLRIATPKPEISASCSPKFVKGDTEGGKVRFYALYIPGKHSLVIEGKPKHGLKAQSRNPGSTLKRFPDRDAAHRWLNDRIASAKRNRA